MQDRVYANFDLLLERQGAGYRARVLDSPAGQGSAEFAVPFSPEERAALLCAASDPGAAQDLGGRLYAAVFAGTVRDLLQRSLQEAERTGAGLRIRLRLAAPDPAPPREMERSTLSGGPQPAVEACPERSRRGRGAVFMQGRILRLRSADECAAPLRTLGVSFSEQDEAAWPWEYLYDAALGRFLGLSAGTPVVRYLELPEPIRPLVIAPPLRLLAVLAGPSGYPPLDAAGEWAGIQAALRPLEQRGRLVIERLAPPTLAALQRRLRQGAYHILHFVGHGYFDATAGDGMLIWEDDAGQGQAVSGHQLAALLHDERDTLRLAVLNACASARGALGDPFSGTAQSLVQGGIPAVIAAQAALDDRAALTFAREFYAAVADGYPVDAALAEARKAIYAQDGSMAWGNLALFMRAPDGRIFATGRSRDTQHQQEGDSMNGKEKPVEIHTGGGAYIGGRVSTGGGKFVGGDDVTIIGDGNVVGDHSRASVIKQAAQGVSVEDFARLLAEMRALLPASGLDPDTAEVVDADVKVVEQQAGKEKPNRTIVASKLEEVTRLLTAAGGLAVAGRQLLPLAQRAVEWAGQLFR